MDHIDSLEVGPRICVSVCGLINKAVLNMV